MNKSDIAKDAANIAASKKEAAAIVNRVFKHIADSLRRGNKVVISGFGSFSVHITKVKTGRNPKTGEQILVPPLKKIRFKQSADFFDKDE
ncbi:MAG: integration host factor subunit beta [Elusimicrobiota bacterium]|jgi:nucleoid DNA-binding protein|nr:integration host factor subunit beta [Elusimicrobiota bacterium]